MKQQPDICFVKRKNGEKHIDFYKAKMPGEDADRVASILLDKDGLLVWANLENGGARNVQEFVEWEIDSQTQEDLKELMVYVQSTGKKPLKYGQTEVLDVRGFNPSTKEFLIAGIFNAYQVKMQTMADEQAYPDYASPL
ncbi:MAG: hypothetical protein WAZ18_03530 [Alphaproteobacteria bacterium]